MPALTHCSQRQRKWPQDHAAQGPAVSFSCSNAQARPSAKQPAASGASRSDATQRLAQQPPSRRPPSSSSNPTPSAQPRPSSTCPRSFSPSSAAHAPRASSSRVYQAPPQAARCCSLAGSVAGGLSRSASAALSGPYSARLSLPRLVSVSPPASSVPVQYWCCPPASANLITLSRGPAKHHPPTTTNTHHHLQRGLSAAHGLFPTSLHHQACLHPPCTLPTSHTSPPIPRPSPSAATASSTPTSLARLALGGGALAYDPPNRPYTRLHGYSRRPAAPTCGTNDNSPPRPTAKPRLQKCGCTAAAAARISISPPGQRRDAEVQRPDDGRLCGNSSNMMRLD